MTCECAWKEIVIGSMMEDVSEQVQVKVIDPSPARG